MAHSTLFFRAREPMRWAAWTTIAVTAGSVELPSSGTAPQKPDKYVKVQIKDDGSLSIFNAKGDEKKVRGIKELKGELAALKAADEKMPILIAGAKETQYKNVIEVLDEAKRAGFQKVGLETASK